MPKYKIDLDDFAEKIFHKMESLSEGTKAHEFNVKAKSIENAAIKTAGLLTPFLKEQIIRDFRI